MKLTVGARRGEGGFALPTILLVATVMLIVLVSSIAATAASRVSLDSQYYNQLAEQAAQSGMARATECLNANGQTPQWSTSSVGKDLRPNSDCAGTTRSGAGVSEYIINGGSGVSNVRTRYTIEAPSGTGIGSQLKIVGITELTRTSSPNSVWRRYDQVLYLQIEPPRTVACPAGFIAVPGDSRFGTDDFCVGKYEAKNAGGRAVSQAAGVPWAGISQKDAIAVAADSCPGCSLISEAQWLTVAHNVASVNGNWTGGAVGSGALYTGHNDNSPSSAIEAGGDDSDGYDGTGNASNSNQRRTLRLSNGEVIWDLAGNIYEWTSGEIAGGKPGGSGLSYREWNSIGSVGSLTPNPLPSFGTSAASGWTSGHGIGRLYSNSDDAVTRAFVRSAAWSYGSATAGIFTLRLDFTPTAQSNVIGFRVAYDPSYAKKTVFVFDTNAPGCTGTAQLPVSWPSSGGTVDWGDGVVESRTSALQSHTYSTPGVYRATFDGTLYQASYYSSVDATNAKCLVGVEQWGSTAALNRVSFYNASNLRYVAEPPTTVNNMSHMFRGVTAFNQNINSWDVGNVTNMSYMFRDASSFNQPLSDWDTSNVTNMTYMFYGASAFNQPLSSWNTSSAVTMNWMFANTSFNQPIGSWNTANVTDISGMFWQNEVFNRPLGDWNVSKVTTLYGIFYHAHAFNQPLNTWNTASVQNMYAAFMYAYAFNQPLNNWNTASVTNMTYTFYAATVFNQNISGWNVTNVTTYPSFHTASALTQANCPPKLW